MSMTSTISFSASVTGDGTNTTISPPQSPIVNANAPSGGPITWVLASGDNSLAVPAGTNNVLVEATVGSAVVKKYRTVVGDTGVTFHAQAFIVPLDGATTLYINAASADSIKIAWL